MKYLQRSAVVWRQAICALAVVAIVTPGLAVGQALLDISQVRQGYIGHAALSQLHRWYQRDDNHAVPLKNQLELLTSDATLDLPTCKGRTRKEYTSCLNNLPKSWKNAHIVRDTKINPAVDGSISLTATIDYVNTGANEDGSLRTARLQYQTELQSSDTVLPQFTAISVVPVGQSKIDLFEPTYGLNRLKSLLHYWLALLEDPRRKLEPFREVLAPSFELGFSSGTISNFATFAQWFGGPASSYSASTHSARNFSYKRLGAHSYVMNVDLDWQGILHVGKELVGQTQQQWIVVDDPSERYARIKTINVKVLKAVGPRP